MESILTIILRIPDKERMLKAAKEWESKLGHRYYDDAHLIADFLLAHDEIPYSHFDPPELEDINWANDF